MGIRHAEMGRNMNIKQAKEEIKHTLRAYLRKDEQGNYRMEEIKQRPVLLMGPPGIGKTAIMEQVARECRVGIVSYTITHHTRQSAIGLPMISTREYGGKTYTVTEYTMSEIIASVYEKMEQTGIREGILFIDEINCVSETLAPMLLQFLQCKTFGSWKLPPGWMIVAAGNPPEYNKSVREFDIVTLDRVKKMDISEDFGVWKEYAYMKSVHNAVISYLEIKRENFYHIETTVDGIRFVTARGWEDLSDLMYAYEEQGAAIDETVVGAYVQDMRIARDFAAYYDLYKKYREHYRIMDILEGNYDGELVARFAGSAFDERLSVMGLLLGALHSRFVKMYQNEQVMSGVYNVLYRMKESLGDMEASPDSLLARMTDGEKKKLEEAKKAGMSDREELAVRQDIIKLLEGYQGQAAGQQLLTDSEVFAYVKEQFLGYVEKGEEEAEKIKEKLSHAFSYIEKAFGGSQEMVVFVTELTSDFYSMQFISGHGCEEYYRYNKQLLLKDRRKELQEDIAALLKEM